MASRHFRVIIEPSAARALGKLDPNIQKKVRLAIRVLSRNPFPPNVKKLVNRAGYRIRIGDYRVLYQVEKDRLLVLVVKIAHRREIYRD